MPDAFPDRGEIRFRAPRDVGDVMNAIVAIVRGNARELLMSFVALIAPVALASGVALALYFNQMGDLFTDPTAMEDDPLAVFNVTYAGIILFAVLGSALTAAAAAGYVRLYREGQAGEITAGVLWDESKGLLLPLIGMGLVYGLIVSVAAVIAIVPCLGILAWFGFLIWTIPYYAVTLAARALDEPTLLGAYQRARVLVKGSWGPTFGALALAFLLFYVVLMVFSIPFYVAMMFIGVSTVETDPGALFTVMGALMAPLQVVSYAGYLIPLLAVFFVHGRLTEELEGTSLHDDLDVLAGDVQLEDVIASSPAPSRPAPRRGIPPPSTPPADDLDDILGPLDPPPGDADDRDDDASESGGFRGGGWS